MANQQKINCPNCNKVDTWQEENRYKPFCSSRCKLIDLGEWAKETRTIPGNRIAADLAVTINNGTEYLDE